jgi:hypothetical protein
VAAAIVVAAIAFSRRHGAIEVRAVDATVAVRIVRRDRAGLPEKQSVVRERARVRAITEALGVDVHPSRECPADYAEAEIGIVLVGNDVYARRNVYVFGLLGDGGSGGSGASVVSVTSAGCRVGPPVDRTSLERELRSAGITGS